MIIPNYSRTFSTIDLIYNSISGVIGYKLYKLYKKIIIDIDSEVYLFQWKSIPSREQKENDYVHYKNL